MTGATSRFSPVELCTIVHAWSMLGASHHQLFREAGDALAPAASRCDAQTLLLVQRDTALTTAWTSR